MRERRGKKVNSAKNAGAAREFATKKKIGRPKQTFDPTTKTWKKVTDVAA